MTYIIKEVCRKKGSIFIEYTSFWKNEGVFAIAIHTHPSRNSSLSENKANPTCGIQHN